MKFLDISGFGHSGKTVVADILKEIDGFQLCNYNFEFNLIRIQGGLLDLKYALVDNWSPVRSDSAVRRFKRIVKRIGPKASLFSPTTLFCSNGMNYDSMFNEKFTKLSLSYISSLVSVSYQGFWPFALIEESMIYQFIARVRGRLGLSPTLVDIYLTDSSDFQLKTSNYLISLFKEIKEERTNVFVLLNSLEPFNSEAGLNLLGDSKQIVVTRDPRDIYASAMAVNDGFTPDFESNYNMGLKKNIVGKDLDLFIKRQKIYHENIVIGTAEDRILRIQYEDLIMNYEDSLNRIYKFLDVDSTCHSEKGKYFNPKKSSANIGLWRNYHDQISISTISESLSDYCWTN